MTAVYGLYTTGDAAQRAVNGLRAAGYADRDITVISAAPMEEYEFSHIDRETYLWYIASGGGLLGLLFSTWLARFTEVDWPITVGNMPIVAWYPNLIVGLSFFILASASRRNCSKGSSAIVVRASIEVSPVTLISSAVNL